VIQSGARVARHLKPRPEAVHVVCKIHSTLRKTGNGIRSIGCGAVTGPCAAVLGRNHTRERMVLVHRPLPRAFRPKARSHDPIPAPGQRCNDATKKSQFRLMLNDRSAAKAGTGEWQQSGTPTYSQSEVVGKLQVCRVSRCPRQAASWLSRSTPISSHSWHLRCVE
jgi:hypothetical protein